MERWVSEVNEGWGLTVNTRKQLCDIHSEYQHIEIFETVNLGKLLMLDGIVQLTSYDEFAYHEMMVNLPFYACGHLPRKALVIGGGDLFGEKFYAGLKRALKPGGAIGTQAESYYLFPDIARRVVKFAQGLFKNAGFAQIHVPTYPTGVIGCCVASDSECVYAPVRAPEEKLQKELRYYTPEIHRGAFMLPGFARKLFER